MGNEKLSKSLLKSIGTVETEEISHLYSVAKIAGEIRKDEMSRMPLHINVIMIAAKGKLKETAHSEILQYLLRKQEILDSFTSDILGLKNRKLSINDVRPAEQDRIDVSIYSHKLCVIIENKVNDAIEQTGQIFRYVQLAKERGYKDDEIIVLYLNSSHWEKPSDKSLTKNGEGIERIPAVIENNLIVKDYAHDIYNWVKNLSLILPSKEEYIKSALHQYTDYLEEYFYLTDKFITMKERIKSIIESEILAGLSEDSDVNYANRIKVLEEAKEDLELLKNGIEERIEELMWLQDFTMIKRDLTQKGFNLVNMKEYGYDEGNAGVKIALNGKGGFIAYGYGDREYIGLGFSTSNLNKQEIFTINRIFKRFGKENSGEEPKWPCWNYIEKETSLLNEYVNFVLFIKDIAENEKDKYGNITFR